MKNTILIAALSLLLSACATTGSTATATEATQAIAAAEAATGKVAKVGYEWRDTRAIIDAAKKAAKAEDYDKAAELAKKAEHQSLAAMEQYKSQKDVTKKK